MPRNHFTVPAADRLPNPTTDLDPGSVSYWISGLPYADPAGVCRTLSQALARLNRYPQRVPARAELMAAFRPPCIRLMRLIPDQTKTPSNQDIRGLMTEMAYGYKHLVNEALDHNGWLKNRKRLLEALYFAAKYLSFELFLAFENYHCKPSNSWREILSIYRLAELQNLHHEPVNDTDQAGSASATISRVLKRVLLLWLLDPSRLHAEEARACFALFNDLAPAAVLENLGDAPSGAGRFLVDLEGVDPPRPPDPDTLPQNPDRFRYLNLLPLSKRLHQLLRQMENRGAEPPEGLRQIRGIDPKLVLTRVLKAWHGRQERRSERQESFGWMLCGCGLSAVGFFLEQLRKGDAADELVPQETRLELDLQHYSPLSGHAARFRRVRCRQVNRSASGMCIRLQLPAAAEPEVGQVLLLQEDLASITGDWHAGIVRRLLRIDQETLEAGVQFIRGAIHSIALGPPAAETRSVAALWVDRGDQRLNSILAQRGLYRPGRELVVEADGPGRVIEAGQLLETTPSFDRFRFQVIDG
jgi:hypothetical protein